MTNFLQALGDDLDRQVLELQMNRLERNHRLIVSKRVSMDNFQTRVDQLVETAVGKALSSEYKGKPHAELIESFKKEFPRVTTYSAWRGVESQVFSTLTGIYNIALDVSRGTAQNYWYRVHAKV